MTRTTISARISLLSTSDEGRLGPLRSGYRSLLRFEGSDVDFGFEMELGADTHACGLLPGSSGRARLSLWAADELPCWRQVLGSKSARVTA